MPLRLFVARTSANIMMTAQWSDHSAFHSNNAFVPIWCQGICSPQTIMMTILWLDYPPSHSYNTLFVGRPEIDPNRSEPSLPSHISQGSFCECVLPMRDDVTLLRRLSLVGRINEMRPISEPILMRREDLVVIGSGSVHKGVCEATDKTPLHLYLRRNRKSVHIFS